MPKARMTALDVRAMVSSITPVVQRLRVANVYDISSKVYVLKLSEGEIKRHLVLEAGVRFHLSDWKRDKQSVPSVFTMRLRKFLRTKRLSGINQFGGDRVVDLTFGYEQNAIHLIVELYSRGNVVLTDHEYIVRASWRQFRAEDVRDVRLGELYPVQEYTKEERFVGPGLQCILERNSEKMARFLNDFLASEAEPRKNNIDKELDIPSSGFDAESQSITTILDVIKNIADVFDSVSLPGTLGCFTTSNRPLDGNWLKGYSHYHPITETNPAIVVEDFSPVPMEGKAGWSLRVHETFYECVDQYFSSVEVAKTEKNVTEKQVELESKVDRIRRDQKHESADELKTLARREILRNCESTQLSNKQFLSSQAQCIERNVDFAAKALEMMKRAIDSGSDWNRIEQMVKEQRKLNHPIASYIQSLDLAHNAFTLLLPNGFSTGDGFADDEELDDETPYVPVELNVHESAFVNVQRLHDLKKAAHQKFERTEAAARRVVASAESAAKKEKQDRAVRTETRPAMQRLRKVFWFERFFWFISTNGYLVLAGRDAMQNEILYRKYLRKHDVYVHAEVHGAASCIIRNITGSAIPQATIDEAGLMSVCRSNAWKTKVLVQAYWVYAHQVSKTPQAGEYVSTGGFIIRGKRNPIMVKKLEMGVGILFALGDEESIRRHIVEDQPEMTSTQPQQDIKPEQVPDVEEPDVGEPDVEEEEPLSESESDGCSDQSVELAGPECHMFRRSHVSDRSVQFGSIEVLPTPPLDPHVDFDDLPPEILEGGSSFSEESIEESSNEASKSVDAETPSSPSQAPVHALLRPDSADEFPPPVLYMGRSAPKDLLAKRTPETSSYQNEGDDMDQPFPELTRLLTVPTFACSPDKGKFLHSATQSFPLSPGRRKHVVDGGPIPRGFLSEDLPPPRDLLKMGSTPSASELNLKKPGGRGKISRAARRQLKRGTLKEVDGERKEDNGPPVVAENASPAKPKSAEVNTSIKLSRGKLQKLKKMKAKYGEQSDEERMIKMKLIGTSHVQLGKPPIEDQEPKEETYWSKPAPEGMPDRNIAEEKSDDEPDEWTQRLGSLQELCGRPVDEDTILFALPVCAPFSALQDYLYKGKLTPGGGKKGKAVQVVLSAFLASSPPDSVQRQLIKAISADELSLCLVANPIVHIHGIETSKSTKPEHGSSKKAHKALTKAAAVPAR